MAGPTFSYNKKSRRYIDNASGRFINAPAVRQAVDAVIDAETAKIRSVAQQLVDGSINLAEWQLQTSAIIKSLHVAMGLAANGGLKNTSDSSLGYIASQIKEQYKYLRDFAKQIKTGDQALNGSLVARAALYTQAARGTFEDNMRQGAKDAGMQSERRMLGPADHCAGCLGQAAQGWQPIGSLLAIGDTPCGGNCRCSFSFKG